MVKAAGGNVAAVTTKDRSTSRCHLLGFILASSAGTSAFSLGFEALPARSLALTSLMGLLRTCGPLVKGNVPVFAAPCRR